MIYLLYIIEGLFWLSLAAFILCFIYTMYCEFSPKKKAEFYEWEKRMRHGSIHISMLEAWHSHFDKTGEQLFDMEEFLKDKEQIKNEMK